MLVAVREFVHTVAHIGDDAESQLLCFVAFAMVFAYQGNQTFGQPDEADSQRALVDDRSNGVVRLQILAT